MTETKVILSWTGDDVPDDYLELGTFWIGEFDDVYFMVCAPIAWVNAATNLEVAALVSEAVFKGLLASMKSVKPKRKVV